MDWLSDLIDPITTTVDDIWYTNEEEAANDTALAISNNELAIAQLGTSEDPQDYTWLIFVGIGLVLLIILLLFFYKRKK